MNNEIRLELLTHSCLCFISNLHDYKTSQSSNSASKLEDTCSCLCYKPVCNF